MVIADEPTTALDVTIQAQILSLMKQLQQETGTSILLITHNLAVVAQAAERVAVMYTGRMVERTTVENLFGNPLHPYSEGLLACLPSRAEERGGKLRTIPGVVPSPGRPAQRLRLFRPLPQGDGAAAIRANRPWWRLQPGHAVRCFLHHDQARQNGSGRKHDIEAA